MKTGPWNRTDATLEEWELQVGFYRCYVSEDSSLFFKPKNKWGGTIWNTMGSPPVYSDAFFTKEEAMEEVSKKIKEHCVAIARMAK